MVLYDPGEKSHDPQINKCGISMYKTKTHILHIYKHTYFMYTYAYLLYRYNYVGCACVNLRIHMGWIQERIVRKYWNAKFEKDRGKFCISFSI